MLSSVLRRLPTVATTPLRRTFASTSSFSSIPTLQPAQEPTEPKLLAYRVSRTSSGSLPVYSEVKNDGQRVSTIIRKVSGDIDVLSRELSSFYPQAQIFPKALARQIVLRGNYVKEVKEWLSAKGF